jgi:hypothetical protein
VTKKQRDLLKALSKQLGIPPPPVTTKEEATREISTYIAILDSETGRGHMRSIREAS